MPTKKDKKNAKDGGGVSAAVTKLAAGKFANSNLSKSPASSVSSPAVQSPEIQPTIPAYDANPSVSPALDALSTTSVSASTAASTNNDWVRSALAGSPGNLISLMGESPPTQPSSYEDHGRLHHGWVTHRQHMSPHLASSPSPPNSIRRPLSFQLEAHHPPDIHSQPSVAVNRRSSLHSQFSHARIGSHPPLPHQPQPHFFGAPDIDFDMTPQSGMKAGERGYYFGFDTLPLSRQADSPPGSDRVVLTGYEGGLEVYSVGRRGLDRVAGLKGLRGGVYNAKLLPWTASLEAADLYPLVAVVVHGPVLPQNSPDLTVQGAQDALRNASPGPEIPGSPRTDGGHRDGGTRGSFTPNIEFYQTSVELYSLKTGKLVDVLLQAPRVPITTSITSPVFRVPPPSGAFSIKADGGSIVVCSGVSGECWVYRPIQDNASQFGCVGKLWTSLQQPLRGDVAEESERRNSSTPPRPNPQSPILAVNGRWLAYCPPSPSSQIALRAHVPVPVLGKATGISSKTPPQLPVVSSSVDLPISEGVMNKIMRETTQELIHGARWVGQQGLQAWNSYWNRHSAQPQAQQARSPPLSTQQWGGSYPPRHDASQFPPTHGTPGQAVTKDPGLVSVVDMESLGLSATLHPLTTFSAPLGCSFLSFSPPGLALFTASSKGDVQTVWDLMCIQYTKSSPLQASSTTHANGPRVRQVAQFSRMTVARIVDVAWSKPNGERIAMVTERGTVHLLDMPSSAFTWPPPRRRKEAHEGGTAASETSSSAVSIASSALGAAIGAARPLMTRPRRSSANIPGQPSSSSIVDSASHGGRVIAASISNSLGRTGTAINQLRQTGENRVSLPPSSILPSSSCVTWITGRRSHSLFVLGDGLVRTFPSKTRRVSGRADKQRTPRGSRYKDFKLPGLPDDSLAPTVKHFIDSDEYLDLSDRELDAGNTVTLDPRPQPGVEVDLSAEASIPQAEIESSAPYQPFHTDRRVSLFEYGVAAAMPTQPSVSVLFAGVTLDDRAPSKKEKKEKRQQQHTQQCALEPESATTKCWAFGQKIKAVKLDFGLPSVSEEDFNTLDEHRALPASSMERVMHLGEDREQIVVTTRRRRGARHAEDEDGFFEDDCEVLDFADQRV